MNYEPDIDNHLEARYEEMWEDPHGDLDPCWDEPFDFDERRIEARYGPQPDWHD